jgi:hypothetical protein
MKEEVLPIFWHEVREGTRVRFTTPSFVKRGVVLSRERWSMVVRFDGEDRDTTLPYARRYWEDHEQGRRDWGLCAVRGESPPPTPPRPRTDADWIKATEAATEYGVTAKQLRNWLRQGKIRCGHTKAGIWVVDRISLGRFLAER